VKPNVCYNVNCNDYLPRIS